MSVAPIFITHDDHDYFDLQLLLRIEFEWSKHWFYSVDPSPCTSYLLGIPTAHNHGFRYCKGGSGPYNRVPVFLSKLVDVHGRQYATDIEKVLYAGRKIVFLSAPLDGHRIGFRPQSEYLKDTSFDQT